MLVSITFPFAFHISVFPIHSSSPAIEFHSCFFFTTDVLHSSVDPSLTHFLGDFPGLGLALVSGVVVPEAGVCTKQKSHSKFLPWPGFEPWTLRFDGHERYH